MHNHTNEGIITMMMLKYYVLPALGQDKGYKPLWIPLGFFPENTQRELPRELPQAKGYIWPCIHCLVLIRVEYYISQQLGGQKKLDALIYPSQGEVDTHTRRPVNVVTYDPRLPSIQNIHMKYWRGITFKSPYNKEFFFS